MPPEIAVRIPVRESMRPHTDSPVEMSFPAFDGATAQEILAWAGDTFGDDLVVTASFGDAVLVHLVSQVLPGADVVLLDTGYLFAETHWYAEELRQRYGLALRVEQPDPDALANLWQTDTNGCCAARKVEPLRRALASRSAWVTGLRRVDSPSRTDTPIVHNDLRFDVVKVNPIATWTDEDVAQYSAIELVPEHPLAARGYASIGCWPCTSPVSPGADPRSGRWAGSTKVKCGLHVAPTRDTTTPTATTEDDT